MTYKTIIDLILLRVGGGELNDDSAVQRSDVEEYLPVALNKVVNDEVYKEIQENRQERNSSGFGTEAIDPAFFRTYNLEIQFDSTRHLYYAALPGIVNSMPADYGINVVSPTSNPLSPITRVRPQDLMSLAEMADVVAMCWHEVYDGESRIYLAKPPQPMCNLLVRASITKNQYNPDDEMDLPSGLEILVIEMAVAHFKDERHQPADDDSDNVDVNQAQHGQIPQH